MHSVFQLQHTRVVSIWVTTFSLLCFLVWVLSDHKDLRAQFFEWLPRHKCTIKFASFFGCMKVSYQYLSAGCFWGVRPATCTKQDLSLFNLINTLCFWARHYLFKIQLACLAWFILTKRACMSLWVILWWYVCRSCHGGSFWSTILYIACPCHKSRGNSSLFWHPGLQVRYWWNSTELKLFSRPC